MKLGELLLDERLISPEQLGQALSEQRTGGGVLGAVLVRLGFVTEAAIAAALARKFGIESVDLEETPPEPVAVARTFASLPRPRAAKLRCCPVRLRDRTLTLAMADPTNVAVLDEVRARTGFLVDPAFAPAEGILRALRSLGPRSRPRFPRIRRLGERVDFLSGTDIGTLTFPRADPGMRGPGATVEARLADSLLVDGARAGATEVHVELYLDFFRVRYRVEGALRVVFQRHRSHVPELYPGAVVDRILLLAGLDAGSLRPQSGSLAARFESGGAEREVEFEVDFLALLYAVRLVLHKTSDRGNLDETVVPATEASKNHALMAAARNGETKFAAALLRSGASASFSLRGDTPLLAASRRGHADVIDLLLKAGVNPAAADRGLDALMMASFGGHGHAVGRLLRSGAFERPSRARALDLAAREGHLDVVDELLAAGDLGVGSALVSASGRNRGGVVRRLLKESKPDAAALGTSLRDAAYTGALEAAKALLEASSGTEPLESFVAAAIEGARDARIPDSFAGHLHPRSRRYAAAGPRPLDGHALVARELLRASSSRPELSADFLARSLSEAASIGSINLVRALLEAGADPGREPVGAFSPLTAAIERNDAEVFDLLLDAGAELTAADLDYLGSPDRSGLVHVIRSRAPVRCRPCDLLPALGWAHEEGHGDFAQCLDPEAVSRELVSLARGAAERGEPALDLSGLGLHRLPEELFEIDSFLEIDLADNELVVVPPQIAKVRNLRTLDLSSNPLTSLPEELGSLENLRTLRVRRARLDTLPGSVLGLASLEHVDASGNFVTSLPDALATSTRLRTLRLRSNALRTFPEALLRMGRLESLELGANRLSELPDGIRELKCLRRLDLSRNPLVRLPETIGELELLEHLDLSRAKLVEIPAEIGGLRSLRRLDLSHNRLRFLPEPLFELSKLERLDLEGNVALALPQALYRHSIRLDFPRIPGYLVSSRLFDLLGLELLELIHLASARESMALLYDAGPSRLVTTRKPRRRRYFQRRR